MERFVKMDMPNDKGVTYRRQLQNGKEKYNIDADDLNPALDVPYPQCYHSAYDAWEVMAGCRANGNPIGLHDIIAYKQLYNIELSDSELEAIFVTDRAFIKYTDTKKD